MTSQYCRNCGKLLDPGTSFCIQCGMQFNEQTPNTVSPSPTQQRSVSKRKPVWMGIAIGLLLIVLGIRVPVVMFFGEQTTARIESVKRKVDQTASQMDYKYEIKYQFVARGGKQVVGSYTITNVYDQSKLPTTNSTVQIKYVPGMTFINAPISQDKLGLGSIFLIALGVFLIVLGIRGNLTIGRSRRR